MADFFDLDGAFKSLTDTLQNRLNPLFDEKVSEHWLGTIGHAIIVGRRVADWNSLPGGSSLYQRLTQILDGSARCLANALSGKNATILAALGYVETALGEFQELLVGAR